MFHDWTSYIPIILIPFIWWGVRRMLLKKGRYDNVRKHSLRIGSCAFFFTEMARSFYRPYIYKNDIFDYYIADTIGNSLGTVTAIFMLLALSGKGNHNDWKLILIIIAGLVAYELLNITHHIIDIRDIIATLIFGALSTGVYWYLLKKYADQIHLVSRKKR